MRNTKTGPRCREAEPGKRGNERWSRKRGKCVEWNFRNRRKGEIFFWPCMNVFLETKDWRRSFWFAEKAALGMLIFNDIERVGSEMMDIDGGIPMINTS